MLNPFERMNEKKPTPVMAKLDSIRHNAHSWQPPSNTSFAAKMEGVNDFVHKDQHRSKLFG